ncbi:MAG: hypothetical protein ABWY06_05025 [Pseudomonas sp.]|uniref:hypothetical protein n=1 Tax=Pseudomonas sp. TaxID=306 RepID=UPI0033923B49
MDFAFSITFKAATPWTLQAVARLLGTPCQRSRPESSAPFIEAARELNQQHGETLARGFLAHLACEHRADLRAQEGPRAWPVPAHGPLQRRFVESAPEIAEDLALFLYSLCPGLEFEIEGDHRDAPHGYRYACQQGVFVEEQGFLSPV